jgi:ornithine carbamoyltransferase
MKHLISLLDYSAEEIEQILAIAAALKAKLKSGKRPALLKRRVLVQIFEKPSLRTRISFEAAMMQLGGSSVFLVAKDAGLNGRESLADVARVLSGYADVVAMRTFSQQLIGDFAGYARCPVINALSDELHPCQALADIFTMREVLGKTDGKRIVYVGDGNNVAASLAIISGHLGIGITVCTPKGYELKPAFVKDLKQRFPKLKLSSSHDPKKAVADADVIYTDVWASMGQEGEADERKQVFGPFQVNRQLMELAPAGCKFMHCLPAKRGGEVTDEVIDGPNSIAFPQAENRMHLAKGLLAWLLRGPQILEKLKD